MRISALISSALVVIALASCSSEQAQIQPEKHASTATNPTAGHINGTHAPQAVGQGRQTGPTMSKEGLPKDLVCMVNDAYMGKRQFPVEFEDRMYYGCCEMCVKTIKSDRQVRVAQDPISGKEVDKSTAFIALEEGSSTGEVVYFESERNYKQYLAKAQTK